MPDDAPSAGIGFEVNALDGLVILRMISQAPNDDGDWVDSVVVNSTLTSAQARSVSDALSEQANVADGQGG